MLFSKSSGRGEAFRTLRASIHPLMYLVANQSLQKDIKTEKYKFRGGPPKTCKIDEVIEPEEFHALFESKLPMGVLIQPTPDNKPNSSVTIIRYVSVC